MSYCQFAVIILTVYLAHMFLVILAIFVIKLEYGYGLDHVPDGIVLCVLKNTVCSYCLTL